MKFTKLKAVLAAALCAVAGAFAYAGDAPEESVVATGEASFWLGGDEIVVASDEMVFQLGPTPGSEENPWKVGGTDGTDDLVEAWTNGTELVVGGKGTVTNLAEIATEIKGGITAINVASNGVTGAEAQAFAGIGTDGEKVLLTLPDGWQGELPDAQGVWYGAYVELTAYPLTVANVTTATHWPWDGKIDVTCDLTGSGKVQLSAALTTNGVTVCTATAANLTGATTVNLDAAGGATNGVRLVWDAKADCPAGFNAKKAKVKVTAKKVEPPKPAAGVQLWKDGPFWAESNIGTSEVSGHPEYGALYDFADAATEVAKLGGDWRLPTKGELEKLTNTTYCTSVWDSEKKGRTFTSTSDPTKSIFLPAAGFDYSEGRKYAEGVGSYWSSEEDDDSSAWFLYFGEGFADVSSSNRSSGLSVRAVRDAK